MKHFSWIAVFAFLVLFAQQGVAAKNDGTIGEAYAVPTYKEISQTLLMLGGVDVNDPKVMEDYAKMVYCGLYKEKFKNDFEWNKVRGLIASRALEKKEMFRTHYEIRGTMKLDRYNFEGQYFPFTKDTEVVNVGSMVLTEREDLIPFCGVTNPSKRFPVMTFLDLNQPLNLTSLKMPMDEAEKFLTKLADLNVKDRIIYVRFRFKIMEVTEVTKAFYPQDEFTQARFLARMNQIDFFFDRDLTKWISGVTLKSK